MVVAAAEDMVEVNVAYATYPVAAASGIHAASPIFLMLPGNNLPQ
jgi:hypothetical protein